MALKTIKIEAQKAIEKARDLKSLNSAFKKYLGKKSELTQILRSLEKLPKVKRVKVGKEANSLKNSLRVQFDKKARELKEKAQKETGIFLSWHFVLEIQDGEGRCEAR